MGSRPNIKDVAVLARTSRVPVHRNNNACRSRIFDIPACLFQCPFSRAVNGGRKASPMVTYSTVILLCKISMILLVGGSKRTDINIVLAL